MDAAAEPTWTYSRRVLSGGSGTAAAAGGVQTTRNPDEIVHRNSIITRLIIINIHTIRKIQ